MFLNIRIDWIILKTYDLQFTLTTKKSLHIIFKGERGPGHLQLIYSKRLSRGQNRYGADADWDVLNGGVHWWTVCMRRWCDIMSSYIDHLLLTVWAYLLNSIYTIQPVVKPVEQPVAHWWTVCMRRWRDIMSSYIDHLLLTVWAYLLNSVYTIKPVVQPVEQPVVWIQPVWFMQPDMQPVVQALWQPVECFFHDAASCSTGC